MTVCIYDAKIFLPYISTLGNDVNFSGLLVNRDIAMKFGYQIGGLFFRESIVKHTGFGLLDAMSIKICLYIYIYKVGSYVPVVFGWQLITAVT